MKEFWDQRYREEGFAYGREPNDYFREVIDSMEPVTLLLPGEGEGRNAIYAARKGWKVSALDQSSKGRDKALKWAREEGLKLDYRLVQLENFSIPDTQFDVIAIIYVHFMPDQRRRIFRQMASCLRNGGKMILECFHKNQLEYNSGGPQHIEMLFSVEDLREDFRSLTIEMCREMKLDITEGEYHRGISSVIRLEAYKPADQTTETNTNRI